MAIIKATARGDLAWRVLSLLNLYRLLVPMVLVPLHFVMRDASSIGWLKPRFFVVAAALYFAIAMVTIAALKVRWPSLSRQAWVHFVVDVTAISLLLYSSGGVGSGLGLLLIVPLGAISLLVPLRAAFLAAAAAALALLVQQVAVQFSGFAAAADYTAAGALGVILFIVALGAFPVAESLRHSEALVRQRDVDLANMAELSQYIVQHLRESILVVDPGDRIRLINESAALILGDRTAIPGALLGEVSAKLLYYLSTWRQNPHDATAPPATFLSVDASRVVQPHFAPLGSQNPGPVLIFLEDTGVLTERVQQSKLAALGRLSASIAHEIRNPVGAMSHAGQLLAESPVMGPEEMRLTEIIRSNADRVSTIINNVLQLSRRDTTRPERLTLGDWLAEFLEEFAQTAQIPEDTLQLECANGEVEVRVDPTHLQQVLWNLCDNALKYSTTADGPAAVDLRCGRVAGTGRPYLEVADRGKGIEPSAVDRIFEPFFTSSTGGTGLGLFIARELCQCNGALLVYEPRPGGGSVFRVIFSDPQRWEGEALRA